MREVQRHIDAFELYFQLKQSGKTTAEAISLVAVELQFSETSIYRWKKEFNWNDREAVRGLEIRKNVEERTNSNIVENKVLYLSFLHCLLDNLKKNFDIKIENVTDLRKVIDGCLVLQGEPSEHIEQDNRYDVNDLDKRFKEYEKKFRAAREDIDSGDSV